LISNDNNDTPQTNTVNRGKDFPIFNGLLDGNIGDFFDLVSLTINI
jgi:hypothetical protein